MVTLGFWRKNRGGENWEENQKNIAVLPYEINLKIFCEFSTLRVLMTQNKNLCFCSIQMILCLSEIVTA